jgi:phosphate transport system permease protein
MIPVVVRSTEEMLKLVPERAARRVVCARGARSGRRSSRIVLPTAFSGIVTGVLLGLARVMGETAPLLILGPYTKAIASDLFERLHGDACRR